MATSKERDKEYSKGRLEMNTPPIVSQQEWEVARQQLLVKEKALTRSRDTMAAERRRMPWMAVEKAYEFEGPQGKVGLLDLFEGRRQLVVYRAFFEPGVFGWPEHACRGCSLGADQVAHLAHLNARDTTLAYASRAPQADIGGVFMGRCPFPCSLSLSLLVAIVFLLLKFCTYLASHAADHTSLAARAIRSNPSPSTTYPTARATRSPPGTSRSALIAAVTAAIAPRSMTPITRSTTVKCPQQ